MARSSQSQDRLIQLRRRRDHGEDRQLLPDIRTRTNAIGSWSTAGRNGAEARTTCRPRQPCDFFDPHHHFLLLLLLLLLITSGWPVATFSFPATIRAISSSARGILTVQRWQTNRRSWRPPAFSSTVRLTHKRLASSTSIQDGQKSTGPSSSKGDKDNTQENDGTPLPVQRLASVKEIKAELQSLGVSFQDCFDKESLFQRLIEARRPRGKQEDADPGPSSGATQSANSVGGDDRAVASSTGDTGGASTSKDDTPSQDAPPSASPKVTTKVRDSASTTDSFHVEEEEEVTIRAMSVKELRSELASHNVRWQSFVDKNDLIRAVQQVRQEAAKFSVTGRLVPGRVGDLTDKEVKRELERVTPMLLDVYATWCGPCQLMGPILEQASEQLHVRVRFAKMDSDKYPELSGRLGVQGLPTLILFKDGAEVGRVEGALRKDQLVEWIQAKLLS